MKVKVVWDPMADQQIGAKQIIITTFVWRDESASHTSLLTPQTFWVMSTSAKLWMRAEWEQGEKKRPTQNRVPAVWWSKAIQQIWAQLLQGYIVLIENRLAWRTPIGTEDNTSSKIITNE